MHLNFLKFSYFLFVLAKYFDCYYDCLQSIFIVTGKVITKFASSPGADQGTYAAASQNFLICIEMFPIAIWHAYAFGIFIW